MPRVTEIYPNGQKFTYDTSEHIVVRDPNDRDHLILIRKIKPERTEIQAEGGD